MDLRQRISDVRCLDRARELVIDGLFNYQPWIFSDRLTTGVGLKWTRQAYSGLVYYPDISDRLLTSPGLRRLIIDPANYADFHDANARLCMLYNGIVDEICTKLGDISRHGFLDVGCNTGHFPQSFAMRGARASAGCDRGKGFARTFELLNEILGTGVKFHDTYFDPHARQIRGLAPHNVVISMAVLCHQAEPLSHLSALASLAKTGLFVWTLVNNDRDYSIHLGEPQGKYQQDAFPRTDLIAIRTKHHRWFNEARGSSSKYRVQSQ